MKVTEEVQRGNNTKESRTTSNENLKQQQNLLGIHEKHGYHATVIYPKKDKYESRFLCNHYTLPKERQDIRLADISPAIKENQNLKKLFEDITIPKE